MNWKQGLSIAAIIFSLGFLIRSFSPAHALSTSSVSHANNPFFSHGAYISSSSPVTISGQSGYELMVSDVFLHADSGYFLTMTLETSTGSVIGKYRTYSINTSVNIQLNSPLRTPEGEDLIINVSGRGNYTISGYKAHP